MPRLPPVSNRPLISIDLLPIPHRETERSGQRGEGRSEGERRFERREEKWDCEIIARDNRPLQRGSDRQCRQRNACSLCKSKRAHKRDRQRDGLKARMRETESKRKIGNRWCARGSRKCLFLCLSVSLCHTPCWLTILPDWRRHNRCREKRERETRRG